MVGQLYFRGKKQQCYTNKNSITTPILIKINNGLFIYTYITYIHSNKRILSQRNLHSTEAYSVYKKENKILNLLSTSLPKIYIKDNLNYKLVLIKYTFCGTNYLFTKNILLPTNIISQITHRQLNNNSTVFFLNNRFPNSSSLLFNSLYKNYIYVTEYYIYWKTLL